MLLVRSQTEIRNLLLETGEVSYVIKWQKTWLNSFGWKADLGSNKLGYLAEEITMQSVRGVTWVLLVVYGKM